MEILLGLLGLALFVFIIYVYVRILHKAGYSGWWLLLLIIPIVNLIMIWVFAFSEWPIHRAGQTKSCCHEKPSET